jgi:hypothetical protein
MNQRELNELIDRHARWLRSARGGERLTISSMDLSGLSLAHADLSFAAITYCRMENTDLAYSGLSHADLSRSELLGALFSNANLSNAVLWKTEVDGLTNFDGACLSGADVQYCDWVISATWGRWSLYLVRTVLDQPPRIFAGCRSNWTVERALEHWGDDDNCNDWTDPDPAYGRAMCRMLEELWMEARIMGWHTGGAL